MIFSDLKKSLLNNDLWLYLAWQDIRLRYRRSKIGPLWITLSMAIFCMALGVVYSSLFKINPSEYIPFLTVSFIYWGLIAGLLGEFANLYVDNSGYLKDIRINPFSLLLRLITRHLIIFAHNFVIVVAVYIYFGIKPEWEVLMVIPGFLLVLVNLLGIGVSLSIVGARFRDVGPITQSLIQVTFFITPITWFPKLLPPNSMVVELNPIAHFLELIRAPLMGAIASAESWYVSMGTAVIFWVLGAIIYSKKSSNIAFWV